MDAKKIENIVVKIIAFKNQKNATLTAIASLQQKILLFKQQGISTQEPQGELEQYYKQLGLLKDLISTHKMVLSQHEIDRLDAGRNSALRSGVMSPEQAKAEQGNQPGARQ